MLNKNIFCKAEKSFNFQPNVDCFVSRLYAQCPLYIAYRPDPYTYIVNAFKVNWSLFKGYIFPPFSLMGKVLEKILTDKAEAIVVAPYWPTQPWFTTLTEMITGEPLVIEPNINNSSSFQINQQNAIHYGGA